MGCNLGTSSHFKRETIPKTVGDPLLIRISVVQHFRWVNAGFLAIAAFSS